jgi:protocatechuate 3,4-dioxygenase alpha subunit
VTQDTGQPLHAEPLHAEPLHAGPLPAGPSPVRLPSARPSRARPLTPSQTVGPFLGLGLPWPDGPFVVGENEEGAIIISGRVLDGAGSPVPDALVETWQAAPDGSFAHPDDPRGGAGGEFRAFGRCPTDASGRYEIVTLRPGPLPWPAGGTEAPHLDVSVFARGLLDRMVTRIYFPDEQTANAADPVLQSIADHDRRVTLVAEIPAGGRAGAYRFDIRLQGARETVFFDV